MRTTRQTVSGCRSVWPLLQRHRRINKNIADIGARLGLKMGTRTQCCVCYPREYIFNLVSKSTFLLVLFLNVKVYFNFCVDADSESCNISLNNICAILDKDGGGHHAWPTSVNC